MTNRSRLRTSRTLVVGASGFLGAKFFSRAQLWGSVAGTRFASTQTPSLVHLNASEYDQAEEFISKFKPDLIINCAGSTNVDKCQKYPEMSWNSNVRIPIALAKLSSKCGAKLIHISTDHFESAEGSVRNEQVSASPTNIYGMHKLMAESFVRRFASNYIIVRTNFFGRGKRFEPSFLDWIINNFQIGNLTKGYEDVYFSPIGVQTLLETVEELIEIDFTGLINISSSESISKFDFIHMVAQKMNFDRNSLVRDRIENGILLAPRPKLMSLDSGYLNHEKNIHLPSIDLMLDIELGETNDSIR
jgi:dTDP-4-dehydrorhamnose reductase